ncbi:DUF4232 domain-containing protein [Actinacidiphila paucisporea]|uniref:DUF4232 domain-containing protein n=1 Tax=Actinacidiphila paucisporea TaxID=310782 RepID=A0A1M6Z1S3_9ACTN|nr:DUF4232 domain-containing protein [Actinacidiphila paucisporea]SHL24461.1 Protein of unknown function [Actinacidiphila paucisporea]
MSRALCTAAVAAAALVASVGLAACDAGSSTSAKPPASTTPSASAPGAATATDAPGTSDPTDPTDAVDAKPGAAGAKASSAGGNGKPAAAVTGRCHTAGLRFSFGNGSQGYSSSDDQQHLQVVMTNTSGRTCTVKGFPGVDLKAADTWSLVRSSASSSAVTLKPGARASFTVTYLPWEAGSGVEFKAKSLVVTPPDETTPVTLTWPGGSVLRQDGATHPGTYVGPVATS